MFSKHLSLFQLWVDECKVHMIALVMSCNLDESALMSCTYATSSHIKYSRTHSTHFTYCAIASVKRMSYFPQFWSISVISLGHDRGEFTAQNIHLIEIYVPQKPA